MARTPSAMDVPFHPDIGLLAQRRRGLLRNPHKAKAQARRLSLRRRPTSRDQPLPRRAQSATAALHLDRRSRQNHRRSQARAPSVRFDPLAPVQGVTFPTPDGGKYRQIVVDIDPLKLQARGLTPADIVNAVNAQNLTLPSGLAKIGNTHTPCAPMR